MRERPTVATQHTVDRPHHQRTVRTHFSRRFRKYFRKRLFMAAGSRAARPVMRDTAPAHDRRQGEAGGQTDPH
jgi:hypothetical protein